MKKTVSYLSVIAVTAAVLFTACGFGFDERPEERAAGFVPVEDITGAPTGGQPYLTIPLAANVLPANANNKRIDWSIKTDGGTNSAIDGARLTAGAEGTVTVTARITNGKGGGVDYVQDFSLQISLTANWAVQDIYGIARALPPGDFTYTLNAQITPSNASYRNIVWSVINDGGTGTNISGNYLTAARKGTVTVRATIADGRLTSDYTQDFSILISRGVVAAGHYLPDYGTYRPCYWVNEERIDLPYSSNESYAYGIFYVGNKQFIAGTDGSALCYWVDGIQKMLPNGNGFLSVAAGGGYVYILGSKTNPYPNPPTYYYWKIDGNSGNVVHTAVLNFPDIQGAYDSYYILEGNKMVVKNDGIAVMASTVGYWIDGVSYTQHCYWLSNDSQSAISPVTISALPNPIQCVGLAGGKVYLAGFAGFDGRVYKPYYYILEDNSYHVSPGKIPNCNFDYQVHSIVDQDGVPVFYGYYRYFSNRNDEGYSSWGTGWNFKDLRQQFNLIPYAYSDGDAYSVRDDCYVLLREPYPSRGVQAPWEEGGSGNLGITGIVVIEDGMLPEGKVGSITAPVWREGEAVSLAAPQVDLYNGQTVTAQGWQTSEDGNSYWTEFTVPSTASMSLNGLYLRYYARGSGGITYYSNTVAIVLRGAVDNITAPSWRDGGAISLTAPAVDLSGVTAQGWQISDTFNGGWSNFTPPSTASMSHNGKFLRYYATSGGQTYYSNTVIITVTLNPPTIITSSLPGGSLGIAYNQTLTAMGSAPITWNIQSGSLPAGLSLSTTGVISGTPTTEGMSNFTVRAVNAAGNNDRQLSITVMSSGGSKDDAIPLNENVYADGNIATSNGEQWFVFTATASTQYIYVETVRSLNVNVYAGDGTTVVGSQTYLYDNSLRTSRTLTVGQMYYIRVTSGYIGTYQIGFNASTTSGPPVQFPSNAIPLTENVWANGSILSAGARQEWFTFTATASTQWLHFGIASAMTLIYVQVYDSGGAAVGNYTYTAMNSINFDISRPLSIGQTYYIRVKRAYDTTDGGAYRIAFNATRMPPVINPSTLTENTWTSADIAQYEEQWFTFAATASTQYIHVGFNTLTNLTVHVYTSAGTVVNETVITTSTANKYVSLSSLTVGQIYYIRARPFNQYSNSTSGTYRIGFNTSTTAPVP